MPKIDWTPIKTDFMTENLIRDRQSPFSLKELASKWHLSYRTVRNHAHKEKWGDELRQRVFEMNRKSLDVVQEQRSFDEAEVRTRQADAAREMLDLALSKLRTIRPQDLSKKEAIELLRIGLNEERRALGLADRYELKAQVNSQERYSPVEEMIKGHQQIEILALRLLSSIGEK